MLHKEGLFLLLVLDRFLWVWQYIILEKQFLVPYEDGVEFVLGNDHGIKPPEGLGVLVHHTEHIESIALNLFDGISI